MSSGFFRSVQRFVMPLSVFCLALVAGGAATMAVRSSYRDQTLLPDTVVVEPGRFTHRLDGEYSRQGVPHPAPRVEVDIDAPVEIMTRQVTRAQYQRCVVDGACQALDMPLGGHGDFPVTGVSHTDAEAYASWLSARTGQVWALPDDRQWAFAAGSRFVDDAVPLEEENGNPARRWLADYDRETERKLGRDPVLRMSGGFGPNEHGIYDMAGNVWEWTSTCQRRVELDQGGQMSTQKYFCGVHVVEGQHRAAMPAFVRNPKNGACSVGTPPDHLGFRLVRQRRWYDNFFAAITP